VKDLDPFKLIALGIGVGVVALSVVIALARWFLPLAAVLMVGGAVYLWVM
jgi:hypothetical protein